MHGEGDRQGQGADGPASPSRAEVRAQLEPILASAEFAGPERARRFLRYVVEEALAGRGERIKAYTIAVEVLGRDEGFDAHTPTRPCASRPPGCAARRSATTEAARRAAALDPDSARGQEALMLALCSSAGSPPRRCGSASAGWRCRASGCAAAR